MLITVAKCCMCDDSVHVVQSVQYPHTAWMRVLCSCLSEVQAAGNFCLLPFLSPKYNLMYWVVGY